MIQFKNKRAIRCTSNLLRISLIFISVAIVSGCLISPYYGQKFSSRSAEIPFTLYTTDNTKSITIECAEATAHGNAYGRYHLVVTIWPSTQGIRDPNGGIIYSASTEQALPDDCYRDFGYPDGYDYITVVRVLQNGSSDAIVTFDKDGLSCLGEGIGKGASWFNWNSCYKVNPNTGSATRTVFLRAKA